VCVWLQLLVSRDGELQRALLPSILATLLKARKHTRKKIPSAPNDFMKNVLDKRQLAFKESANSRYGATGTKISAFYQPDVVASTTATGRKTLTLAQRILQQCYTDEEVVTSIGRVNTVSDAVSDIDTDAGGTQPIEGDEALRVSIEVAQVRVTVLPPPHDYQEAKA
jgi:DNA polymerase elongation subunit (family B)